GARGDRGRRARRTGGARSPGQHAARCAADPDAAGALHRHDRPVGGADRRPPARDDPRRARVTLAYRFWRIVFRALLGVLFRLRVEGIEHIPLSGPVVLVPNHLSFLDPPVVGVYCPRAVRFVARSTLARNRLFGAWMRSVGVLLIDREAPARASLGRSIEALAAGQVLAVFPEGTRSRDGRLHEFKKGILKLLKETGATAVPTGIIGTFEAWP